MVRFLPFFLLWLIFSTFAGAQADYKKFYDDDKLPTIRNLFDRGRFSIVIQNCDVAIRRQQPSPEWRTLKMRSLANLGRYEEAIAEANFTEQNFSKDLAAMLVVHELYRTTGKETEQKRVVDLINAAATAVPIKDRSSMDLVNLGKAALVLGADPAMVLEKFYGPAKQVKKKGKTAPPGLVEAHQAAGELALDKSDFALAATEFRAALKHEPNHPELRFGLAQALMSTSRKEANAEVDKILENYSFHFGALMMRIEAAINFERYEEAQAYIRVIQGINPRHWGAWAMNAVLANLQKNDPSLFADARKNALEVWPKNPEVDHLIGRVLSRNYRFAEGAESQKRALKLDPNYLDAKLQLAVDYLRLGNEEAAWPLASEVAEADQYNVLAYNLEILEDEIASYEVIKTDDFIIRMPSNEAELYGDRALALLEEAHTELCKKYKTPLEEPTLIEFFPNQPDFAIRTFGSLGGEGLLGVCSGTVVTMNSPGSITAGKNNWEATLWHEFAHVVTLTATKNKMPRWLSEGISVYEEIQKQPNWGQRMTPRYRKMILEDGDLTPISKLSSAFYTPKTNYHILFAYYESMLVVEYIIDNFGLDALNNILTDLASGILINEAIAKNTKDIEKLEIEFAKHVFDMANNLGPGVDWSEPDTQVVDPRSNLAVAAFLKKNPKNFWAHKTHTKKLVAAKRWDMAIKAADNYIKLFPDNVSGLDNGYFLKATAYRGLGQKEKEAATLRALSEKSAEAYSAYTKLLALDLKSKNWPQLLANADRAMAINPFLKDIHYCRGCANQSLNQPEPAIQSFEKLLKLKPANPSEIRYRLATLFEPKDETKAKRYVMDALADSPRYREAYSLFLKIKSESKEQE